MIYREKAIKLFDRLRPEGSFTGSRRCNGVNCKNCPFKTIPHCGDILELLMQRPAILSDILNDITTVAKILDEEEKNDF